MSQKKACVLCSGCPESRFDSARVEKFLIVNGWEITVNVEDADLILYRACGLTNVSIDQSLQAIRHFELKRKEGSQLIVWGCLPKINQEALRSVYDGVTFSESDSDILEKIIDAKKPLAEVSTCSALPVFKFNSAGFKGILGKVVDSLSKRFSIVQSKKIYLIKVSTGCLDNCSFCGVRISRGTVRSKSIDEIVCEFQNGLKMGFRHFGLLATDLGAYGQDIGHTLVELVAELTKQEGDYKIGLRNINPHHLIGMFDKLRPFFASGKIWFLSSALESGSNRILALMRRRYTVEEFVSCFRTLNVEYPQIFLRTQFLVGFPTETDEDFKMSKSINDVVKFDWVEIYEFSPTVGTFAATLTDQIAPEIKSARAKALYKKTLFQHPCLKIRNLFRSFY